MIITPANNIYNDIYAAHLYVIREYFYTALSNGESKVEAAKKTINKIDSYIRFGNPDTDLYKHLMDAKADFESYLAFNIELRRMKI